MSLERRRRDIYIARHVSAGFKVEQIPESRRDGIRFVTDSIQASLILPETLPARPEFRTDGHCPLVKYALHRVHHIRQE